MSLEQLGKNTVDGSVAPGIHKNIISGEGSTYSLSADESGSTCLYDSATGVVYTLPAPVKGMFFDFRTSVTITSNSAKVLTNTIASEFILGTLFGYTTDATEIDGFIANGTNIVSVVSNGTTTGGVIGDCFRLTAISTTQWLIEGNTFCGTSTPATPFATS